MTLGFVSLCIMGFIIGGALQPLKTVFPLFIILYGIFQAMGEMGPGVSTFLCASESFPTPVRGHFVGLAAAMGKVGAAVGKFSPKNPQNSPSNPGLKRGFTIYLQVPKSSEQSKILSRTSRKANAPHS